MGSIHPNDARYFALNGSGLVRTHKNRLHRAVGGLQTNSFAFMEVVFDRSLSIDHGHNDVSIPCTARMAHDDDVTIVDALFNHRVAPNRQRKGGP